MPESKSKCVKVNNNFMMPSRNSAPTGSTSVPVVPVVLLDMALADNSALVPKKKKKEPNAPNASSSSSSGIDPDGDADMRGAASDDDEEDPRVKNKVVQFHWASFAEVGIRAVAVNESNGVLALCTKCSAAIHLYRQQRFSSSNPDDE